ncbi:hypothetical protein B9Z55_004896 [Caenorhabditis nigoni]|uniref:Uncharacterized protein n=1 Tax=Caenorhabditis nigoni TaxID=1611254 RepID=A0A2G5UYH0_9PELO|nr:hypothetical protein B9Z55_004896 [Caenorhabditis nigoni]
MGLSAEVSGKRMLKSEHGTYLRAYKQSVDLKRGCACASERWFVEDLGGKVDLVATDPHQCPAMWWQPYQNSDGTWSFRSTHGTWLSGLGNDVVCCMPHCRSSEKFTLPSW